MAPGRYEQISIGRLTVLSQHNSRLRRRKTGRGEPRRKRRRRRYEKIDRTGVWLRSIGRLTVLSQYDSRLRRRKMERRKPRRRPRRRRYEKWIETAVWLRGNVMNFTARFKTGAKQKKANAIDTTKTKMKRDLTPKTMEKKCEARVCTAPHWLLKQTGRARGVERYHHVTVTSGDVERRRGRDPGDPDEGASIEMSRTRLHGTSLAAQTDGACTGRGALPSRDGDVG